MGLGLRNASHFNKIDFDLEFVMNGMERCLFLIMFFSSLSFIQHHSHI